MIKLSYLPQGAQLTPHFLYISKHFKRKTEQLLSEISIDYVGEMVLIKKIDLEDILFFVAMINVMKSTFLRNQTNLIIRKKIPIHIN